MCQMWLRTLSAKDYGVLYCPAYQSFSPALGTLPAKNFGMLYVPYLLKVLAWPTDPTSQKFWCVLRAVRTKNVRVLYVSEVSKILDFSLKYCCFYSGRIQMLSNIRFSSKFLM